MPKFLNVHSRKLWMTVLCLAAIGVAGIVFGSMLTMRDTRNASEAKKFQELLIKTQTGSDNKEYDALSKITDSWETFASKSRNPIVNAKAFYNMGWTNLNLFAENSDINAYRASRGDIREALRYDPVFYDAKFNLVYLENLAQEKGIELEEVPIASGDTGGTEASPLTSNLPNKIPSGEEKGNLRDKITVGGSAHGLGGEPFEINPDPEEDSIPQKSNSAY